MARPYIYISSTIEDLKEYRNIIRKVSIDMGFVPSMMEYFSASDKPVIGECISRIKNADIFVALIAHRYGWIPSEQIGSNYKSIVWLEYENALSLNKPVLIYIIDEKHPWPEPLKEEYKLAESAVKGELTPQFVDNVQRNVTNLRNFKNLVMQQHVIEKFTTPENLAYKFKRDLIKLVQHNEFLKGKNVKYFINIKDQNKYLNFIRDQYSHIDIRGIAFSKIDFQKFSLKDIYVPQRGMVKSNVISSELKTKRLTELIDDYKHILIIGDPGSGKTTFLKYLVLQCCDNLINKKNAIAHSDFKYNNLFPMYIRSTDLIEQIKIGISRDIGPTTADSALWISFFMEKDSHTKGFDFDISFFNNKIDDGSAILLLDGVDELSTSQDRDIIFKLLQNLKLKFPDLKIVITSRPIINLNELILSNFELIKIIPLDQYLVKNFVSGWSKALFPQLNIRGLDYDRQILDSIRSHSEINILAQNPLMLLLILIIHRFERKLPYDRGTLVERIITLLIEKREKRPGRRSSENTLEILQNLALSMQCNPEGRMFTVSVEWAEKVIANSFTDKELDERQKIAKIFLNEELLDSGILIIRGNNICFWHLIFQEFLVAQALSKKEMYEIKSILINNYQVYNAEWKEVTLVLVSQLYRQGMRRIDEFIGMLNETVDENSSLSVQSNYVELIQSIEKELDFIRFKVKDQKYNVILAMVKGVRAIESITKEAENIEKITQLEDIIGRLPEGTVGYLKETTRIREMINEIVQIQLKIDIITQPILREPFAQMLVKEIENFRYRIEGFSTPLSSTLKYAATNWLKLAKIQLDNVRCITTQKHAPQVFRAGDPIDVDQEAFVYRYNIIDEIEKQITLKNGCPGIILYSRRRMGKSTILRTLSRFLSKNIYILPISMQNPLAFSSLKSFLKLVSKEIFNNFTSLAKNKIPINLTDFFINLDNLNQHLKSEQKRLVIALDEYEYIDKKIGEKKFDDNLLATIRESIQSHRNLIWLFSGSHSINELKNAKWTSYLTSLRTIIVKPFVLSETKYLLTDPLQYSSLWSNKSKHERPHFASNFWGKGGIELIHNQSGGWPYFVQLLAETIIDIFNDENKERVDKKLVDLAIEKSIVRGHNVIYELMYSESKTEEEWEYLMKFKNNKILLTPEENQIIESLKQRLLVKKEKQGWQLSVPLFEKWLQNNY